MLAPGLGLRIDRSARGLALLTLFGELGRADAEVLDGSADRLLAQLPVEGSVGSAASGEPPEPPATEELMLAQPAGSGADA